MLLWFLGTEFHPFRSHWRLIANDWREFASNEGDKRGEHRRFEIDLVHAVVALGGETKLPAIELGVKPTRVDEMRG